MSKSKPAAPARRIQGAMSKDQVNAQFNPRILIPTKIRAALKELGTSCCKPQDFAKLAGIAPQALTQYQDEFAEYLVHARQFGRAQLLWCGDMKTAAELNDELVGVTP